MMRDATAPTRGGILRSGGVSQSLRAMSRPGWIGGVAPPSPASLRAATSPASGRGKEQCVMRSSWSRQLSSPPRSAHTGAAAIMERAMPPPDMSLRRSVVLRRRPSGAPDAADFDILEDAIPSPGPGEVVTRTIWLSIDPYMRGRLREQQTYAKAIEIGEVMTGETVGQVIASADPGLAVGD